MIAKLTLIGGSSINTPELVSCLSRRGLVVDEVCLVARSADKLETVQRFCRRLCDELGLRTQVSATTSALQSVAIGLLDEHLRHCVTEAVAAGGPDGAAKVAEATAAIGRLVRS